ncbi:hypothetical protein ES707_15304 [subsurface metagenome]
MKVFQIIIGLIVSLLSKIFPFTTHKGVINTQISIYNRLKSLAPEMPESDLLNRLIISRIKSRPRVAPQEEEYAHYKPLLENPDKTLEDVIWAIVEYEYILSRDVFDKASKMGLPPTEMLPAIDNFTARVAKDIKESIEKRVKKIS